MAAETDSLLDGPLYAVINRLGEVKRRVAGDLDRLGLHSGQDVLLAQLWRTDGLPQRCLASQLCVSPANVTQMLRGMERNGLVRRERDASDARIQRVWLTDAGAALREPVTAIWRDAETELFTNLDRSAREALRRLA